LRKIAKKLILSQPSLKIKGGCYHETFPLDFKGGTQVGSIPVFFGAVTLALERGVEGVVLIIFVRSQNFFLLSDSCIHFIFNYRSVPLKFEN
jgi:hypothetical protein